MYPYYYRNVQPKSEISHFNGEDVDGWLNELEGFFNKYRIIEHQKLSIATSYLAGGALDWYNQWHREIWFRWFQVGTWEDFVRDLQVRFKPLETPKSESEEWESILKKLDEVKQIISELKASNSACLSNLLSSVSHKKSDSSELPSIEKEYKIIDEEKFEFDMCVQEELQSLNKDKVSAMYVNDDMARDEHVSIVAVQPKVTSKLILAKVSSSLLSFEDEKMEEMLNSNDELLDVRKIDKYYHQGVRQNASEKLCLYSLPLKSPDKYIIIEMADTSMIDCINVVMVV